MFNILNPWIERNIYELPQDFGSILASWWFSFSRLSVHSAKAETFPESIHRLKLNSCMALAYPPKTYLKAPVTLQGETKNAKLKLKFIYSMKALRCFRKHVSLNIPGPVSCNLLTTQPGCCDYRSTGFSHKTKYYRTTSMFLHHIQRTRTQSVFNIKINSVILLR